MTKKTAYELCQTGTQQSPIALSLKYGLSIGHQYKFDYPNSTNGSFYNWGFGPAFDLPRPPKDDYTKNPSFTFDNTTVYLKGWHIHSPSEHSVGGEFARAEMHFVHVDAEGHAKAVLGFRIDASEKENAFFAQLPDPVRWNDTETRIPANINLKAALASVYNFNEFWTYRGSLTSPPCTEGIRWFVAKQVMYTSVKQMRKILGASTYSSRVTQKVWQHRIHQ